MTPRISVIIIFLCLLHHSSIAQFSREQQDLNITSQAKKQVIDTITEYISHGYVFPDIAIRVVKAIRTFQESGDYDKIQGSKAFADTVNHLLMSISNDKHLSILFSHNIVPPKTDKEMPLPDFIKQFAVETNYGFKKIDILEGNIGYINIMGFFPFDEATDNAIAAFNFLANTQAMIIDLRNNNGGVGGLANFILSYFFDQRPVEFLEVNFRKNSRVEQSWSSFYVPGKRYLGKPVFVLTSHATFSAGEAFAYILQSQNRATIVGETTGGGANAGDLVRVNDHFVMNLPVGRPVSPITKANWEGVGVKPDIPIAQDKALSTAHIEALQRLVDTTTDEKTKDHLKAILKQIQSAIPTLQ